MKKSKIIAVVVDSLNKMMETKKYQNATQEVKQNMIFDILDKFKAQAKKKSSKGKKK